MVRDLLLLVYASAIGFVSAGITASFYRMVTSEPARFGPAGTSSLALVSAFFLGALAGPIIILQSALNGVRERRIPRTMLGAGVIIAGLWSGCIGILVLDVALRLRDIVA